MNEIVDFDLESEIAELNEARVGSDRYFAHSNAHAMAFQKYASSAKVARENGNAALARKLNAIGKKHKAAAEALSAIAAHHVDATYAKQDRIRKASTMNEELDEAATYKYQGEPIEGVTVKRVEAPSYHKDQFEVQHQGEHIGHVYSHETDQFQKPNSIRMQSGGKRRTRWGYEHKAGGRYSQYTSKKDAVEELVGHHIRHHLNKTNEDHEVGNHSDLIEFAITKDPLNFQRAINEKIVARAQDVISSLQEEVLEAQGTGQIDKAIDRLTKD